MWSIQMLSRQFVQYILGLFFLVTSSLVLSNTEFTYNNNGESIEILGCEAICPLNLVIPNKIDGLPVTKIGWAAFHNNHLTSVFIPNSVTTISNQAFENNNLSSIVIPESVSTIGWLAFKDNNIEAVSLPSGLERIDDGVFLRNQLTEIIVPNNVTFIGISAFQENEINSITLSNNLMLISSDAFRYNNITNLNIPDSVVSINERAFFQNPIDNVTFLGDRPNIGKDAFSVVQEKDESFWDTTYGYCHDINSDVFNNELNCDSNTNSYNIFDSTVVINFCENSDDWPGESLFINESSDGYSICTDSIPASCSTFWTKELASPQLNDDCPVNVIPPDNIIVNYSVFDIDQNGSFDALTDGLIILRYAFGLRGDSLINNAVASDANRTSAEAIEAHIKSYLP